MPDTLEPIEEFGDEQHPQTSPQGTDEFFRVKLPRGKQTFGILEQRLGGSRMRVRCFDGKTRICRVPGRLKKKLWVREGDLLLIEPWQLGGDEKGDVIYKYKSNQVDWLKRKGYLKEMDQKEEF
ncbi:translation initiation factor eIF-1A [Candidatus Woesearchaeota archaeon]|nr:translation initiation factor eIF-1A [Candidatus Woesearchaeota archaeon]